MRGSSGDSHTSDAKVTMRSNQQGCRNRCRNRIPRGAEAGTRNLPVLLLALGLLFLLATQSTSGQVRMRPDGVPIGPDGQPLGQPGNPGQAQPGAPPEKPATTRAAIYVPSSTRPTTNTSASVKLDFRDATADSVLDYLAEATGFTLIKEAQIDGRVTIQTKRAVTPTEAVALLNTVLRIQGYTLIQQDHELRVLSRAKAKKTDVPVHFGANPEEIPATDELITQVIPVGKSDAARLKQELQALVSPDADFTANRDNNSLVLTDLARNVRHVVQIVASLDRQGASSSEMRIIHLKNADATLTSKLITNVFKSAGGDAMSQQMMMMMQQQGQMQGDSLDRALRGGKSVVAVPDDRTGTLVVTGPSDSLKLVDKIIEALDKNETTAAEVRIFTLKFADADSAAKLITDMFKSDDQNPFGRFFFYYGYPQQDSSGKTAKVTATADYRTGTLVIIADIVSKIDNNPATESAFFIHRLKNGQALKLQNVLNTLFGVGPESNQNNQQQQQQQQQNQFGNNFGNQQFGGRSSSSNRTSRSGNNSNGIGTGIGSRRGQRNGNYPGQSQLSSNSQHMIGEMAGEVFVVANEDTNSLLVTTASKYREQVKQIIEELDRPVPQVLIKVLVAEVTHDNSADLGTDFSVLNRRNGSRGDANRGVTFGSNLGSGMWTSPSTRFRRRGSSTCFRGRTFSPATISSRRSRLGRRCRLSPTAARRNWGAYSTRCSIRMSGSFFR